MLGRRETDEQVLNMFESKEEVERTILALKIFPDIGHVGDVEQEEPDTDEEEYAPQVGRDFLILYPHMISNAKLKESKNNYIIEKCTGVPRAHRIRDSIHTKSLLWSSSCHRSTKSSSHQARSLHQCPLTLDALMVPS